MRPIRPWAAVITAWLTVLACGGTSVGPTTEAPPSPTPIAAFDGLVIDMVSKGQVFSKLELQVPAGAPLRILLDNQDKDVYHGVSIAVGATPAEAREATLLYKGDILAGPGIQAYDIPALEPGSYWFFCQPHASMNGTITVE